MISTREDMLRGELAELQAHKAQLDELVSEFIRKQKECVFSAQRADLMIEIIEKELGIEPAEVQLELALD